MQYPSSTRSDALHILQMPITDSPKEAAPRSTVHMLAGIFDPLVFYDNHFELKAARVIERVQSIACKE